MEGVREEGLEGSFEQTDLVRSIGSNQQQKDSANRLTEKKMAATAETADMIVKQMASRTGSLPGQSQKSYPPGKS